MVIHHFLLDLVVILDAPEWLFYNQYSTSTTCLRPLHHAFRRVVPLFAQQHQRGRVFAIAMLLTLVTRKIDIIVFGVLHLLGFCMMFTANSQILGSTEGAPAPLIYTALIVPSAIAAKCIDRSNELKFIWPFGLTYSGFSSADYFPYSPAFVFLWHVARG